MAIPVGAIFSGVARATAGGARAAAGTAMGGVRETARGAARGAVKRVIGGSGKKMKSPVSGMITAVKGGTPKTATGGGGGTIVPRTSSIVPVPKSESSLAAASPGGTIVDQLRSINSTLQQILEVERKEKDKLEDTILDFVRRDERQKRDEEQARQEKKKGRGRKKESPLIKASKKAIGGIWDFIFGLVGDFIKYKILDWIGDPKNRKNVQRIVEFIQGLVGFLNGLWKHVIAPLGGFVFTQLFNTMKLFGSILTPIIDLFTLKWLTNPKEFIEGIINIPKTFIGAMKDASASLINLLTFGLFDNIGSLIDSIIKNFNPFNLFGGGDKEEVPQQGSEVKVEGTQQQGSEVKVEGTQQQGSEVEQQTPSKDIPKLEKGGIVGKQKESANATVQPLTKLIEESKLSGMISEGIIPFMKMMTASFKIIGTAIVGLMLKTLSKIPFVGELIEPIIRMSAKAFGAPSEVLTQLKMGTKKDTTDKSELDEKELAKEMLSGVKELEVAKENESVMSKLTSGFSSFVGGIGGVLGSLFTSPARAATRPTPSPLSPGDSDTPDMQPGQVEPTIDPGSDGSNIVIGEKASAYSASRGRPHRGRDIAAPAGLGLRVPTDSVITDKGTDAGYGNYVVFQDANGIEHLYGHMLEQSPYNKGDKVSAGTVIGRVGSTGRSSGPHLHWEVSRTPNEVGRPRQKVLDPIIDFKFPAKAPFGAPISAEQLNKKKPGTSIAKIKPTASKTGPALQQVQSESFVLDKVTTKKQTPSAIFSGGNSSTNVINETAGQPTLGLTLPSSGLWATYRTNL